MPTQACVPQGFEPVEAPGECCRKCEQTSCVINRPGGQHIILKVREPHLPMVCSAGAGMPPFALAEQSQCQGDSVCPEWPKGARTGGWKLQEQF